MSDLMERFQALKEKESKLKNQLSVFQGKLESLEQSQTTLIQEIKGLGVDNIDDLQGKITELRQQVTTDIDKMESVLTEVEEGMEEIGNE